MNKLYALIVVLLFSLVLYLFGWCYTLNANLNSLYAITADNIRYSRQEQQKLEKEIRLLQQDKIILQEGWD